METKTVKYINVNGKLMDLSHPQVMGILNVTPDSFYAGSRQQTEKDIINRTSQIIEEGASIIDIGAYSSRVRHDCQAGSTLYYYAYARHAAKYANESAL